MRNTNRGWTVTDPSKNRDDGPASQDKERLLVPAEPCGV